ncbi:Hypothetical predicted protein [Mytilus galloprovincialis]|uniref:Uncharacterized protein n=1 Tax=Mytilus galloprovincialis TaxID=29158 RepID=A0A8B6H9R8_MYTGA|nr:Hypothetical predicted protein [Mytilus galloprovincialis]
MSELYFVLLVVILCYISESSCESLDQDPKSLKSTQHLYQEFQYLRLNKSSNGTGLILPEVLQEKFQRGELRCQSSCNHIQCCICDSYYDIKDYDILNVIQLPDFNSILSLYDTSTFSQEHIILSPNESLHNIPSNICDYPNIGRVYLQYNEIKDIDIISCLEVLDTLVLHHNLVEYFK